MTLTVHLSRLLIIVLPIVTEIGCAADRNEPSQQDSIQAITSVEQFNSIIENAGSRLLVFNLYADWCMPCHVLAPTLTEIATENKSKITIFKVDTDQFPQITAAFGVTGIPFVVFVKNKKAIYALIGVQPKDSYTKIIEAYTDSTTEPTKPRGRKVEGIEIKGSGAQYIYLPLAPSRYGTEQLELRDVFHIAVFNYTSDSTFEIYDQTSLCSKNLLNTKYHYDT
jgi:thioredoxin 1